MAPTTTTHKGLGEAPTYDGSSLRIGIVHARWNTSIIAPLLAGTKKALLARGVKESNIVVQSVPGSWELPIAVQRLYSASQIQSTKSPTSSSLNDLLGSSTPDLSISSSSTATPQNPLVAKLASHTQPAAAAAAAASSAPFDALIAIGVLIKGETMHFEYISEAVSQGLMRVGLDLGVPVIFGVLTVLTEEQALERAGVGRAEKMEGVAAHNHGEDWGAAAVELGMRRREWAEGKIVV